MVITQKKSQSQLNTENMTVNLYPMAKEKQHTDTQI